MTQQYTHTPFRMLTARLFFAAFCGALLYAILHTINPTNQWSPPLALLTNHLLPIGIFLALNQHLPTVRFLGLPNPLESRGSEAEVPQDWWLRDTLGRVLRLTTVIFAFYTGFGIAIQILDPMSMGILAVTAVGDSLLLLLWFVLMRSGQIRLDPQFS